MRRLVAALLALFFLVAAAPAASAAPQEAPQQAVTQETAALPAGMAAGRPADFDVGTCAQALIPAWGLLSGAAWDCTGEIADAGAGVVTEVATEAFEEFFDPWVDALVTFVSDLIYTGFTWWLMPDGLRISNLGIFGADEDALNLPSICLGIGVFICTLLTIFQGLRTIIRRKGTPLLQALQGLMLHVLAVALGVAVIDGLLAAADALTEAILAAGFESSEDAPERIVAILLPQIGNPVGLMFIAFFVLLIGLIQLVMLFLRQAAMPVLALLLPVASSGQVGEGATRQWLPRLITMMFTIICYKPIAALIITVGFVEMESSTELLDWIRGFVTLVLSVVSLGAMLKLFAPFGVAGGDAIASAGGLARAAASVADLITTYRRAGGGGGDGDGDGGGSSQTSVTQHAGYMAQHGPAQQAAQGDGGSASAPREGDTAVRQSRDASSQLPDQTSSEPAGQGSGSTTGSPRQGEGEAGGTPGGNGTLPAQAPASPGAGGSAGSPPASSGAGGVSVAVVAAETGKRASDKGAGTMSGDGQR